MRFSRIVLTALLFVLFVFSVSEVSFSATKEEILTKIDRLSEKAEKAEKDYAKTKTELDKTNKRLNSSISSGKEKDSLIKKLKNRIASLNKKLKDQEKEISSLQAEIQQLKSQLASQGVSYNPPLPSGEWHPQAKYRVTRWNLSGNMTVEIEAKDGQKVPAARGVKEGYNGRKISLRVPIEFTVPDGVEVIHMDLREGFNYKILDNGSLGELDTFEGQDERGNTHRGRQAYPGDRVLMVKSGAMTVWLLQ